MADLGEFEMSVIENLHTALEVDDPKQKNFHIRQALQLMCIKDDEVVREWFEYLDE